MALAQAKQEVALSTFEEVMALAAETNMLEPLAVANFGMARALAMGSRAEHAFPHAREALALFQRMDHQQRHEVAAWIRQHDRSTG